MNKSAIILCLLSTVTFQAPAISISAKLSGQTANKAKSIEKAGKALVLCACDDLLPAVQELLIQSKSDIKELVKLQIAVAGISKDQLNSIKFIIKDAQPLLLEGAHVAAQLVNKYGKNVLVIYKKTAARMLMAADNNDAVINPIDQKTLEATFALVADDAQFNQYMEKLARFNDKWADSFAAIMATSLDAGNDKGAGVAASALEESKNEQAPQCLILRKILMNGLNSKRALDIQSLIIPIISEMKTEADIIQLTQACLNELEEKIPSLMVSSEKFAEFTIPFLANILTESVDEILKSLPA